MEGKKIKIYAIYSTIAWTINENEMFIYSMNEKGKYWEDV